MNENSPNPTESVKLRVIPMTAGSVMHSVKTTSVGTRNRYDVRVTGGRRCRYVGAAASLPGLVVAAATMSCLSRRRA